MLGAPFCVRSSRALMIISMVPEATCFPRLRLYLIRFPHIQIIKSVKLILFVNVPTVALGIVFAHRFREVEAYVEVQICITYSFPYANRVLF